MTNAFTQKNLLYWFFTAAKIADKDTIIVLGKEFQDAILDRVSRSYINTSAVGIVKYSSVSFREKDFQGNEEEKIVYGIVIKPLSLLMSQVVYRFIFMPIPVVIRERYPELTEAGWEKLMIVAFTILKTLERLESEFIWEEGLPHPPLYKRICAYRLFTAPLMIGEMPLTLLSEELISSLQSCYWIYHHAALGENADYKELTGLSYGEIGDKKVVGIHLTEAPFELARLIAALYYNPIPREITEAYPQLSLDDWKATIAVLCALLTMFETDID